ncbi:MAG: hypothetical protein AAF756_02260 [Pseudomonadota bacterium]
MTQDQINTDELAALGRAYRKQQGAFVSLALLAESVAKNRSDFVRQLETSVEELNQYDDVTLGQTLIMQMQLGTTLNSFPLPETLTLQ